MISPFLIFLYSILFVHFDYIFVCGEEISGNSDNSNNHDAKGCTLKPDQHIFEVLPGYGWDNLRNIELSPVIHHSFNNCRFTEDLRYVVPDTVNMVPMKLSSMTFSADYITKVQQYKSSTSISINGDASLSANSVTVGGSFSNEISYIRKKIHTYKSGMTKVQLKYDLYTISTRPDSPLNPQFRNRLLDIAAHQSSDKSGAKAYAKYLSELLIRDFGTHVIRSAVAGASLTKVDFVKSDTTEVTNDIVVNFTRGASLSFASLFKASMKISISHSTSTLDFYNNKVLNTDVMSYGGPQYGVNMTLDQWEKGLANNLVAIDRMGDPLHYVITSRALPELSDRAVYDLSNIVRDAILRYYDMNTYAGCTDINSLNFDSNANTDNHDCEKPRVNYTIGGVYQTCQNKGSSDYCNEWNKKNPLTGDYSCPENYIAMHLFSGSGSTYNAGFWHLYKKYSTTYAAFWCSPVPGQAEHVKGYMLGGFYTAHTVNPITNGYNCPPTFTVHSLDTGFHLCLGYDEAGIIYNVPFGGFFTCSTGNPLAAALPDKVNASNPTKMLNIQVWPNTCPLGFSRHVLGVSASSCMVSFCIKSSLYENRMVHILRRPPFTKLEELNYDSLDMSAVRFLRGLNGEGYVMQSNGHWEKKNPWWNFLTHPIAIAVLTVVLASIICGMVFGLTRLARRRRRGYGSINGSPPYRRPAGYNVLPNADDSIFYADDEEEGIEAGVASSSRGLLSASAGSPGNYGATVDPIAPVILPVDQTRLEGGSTTIN